MAVDTLPSVAAGSRRDVKNLFHILRSQGHRVYSDESITQLQHSLQAGMLAEQAGADDETVIAALLHDVGRFIPAEDKKIFMEKWGGAKARRFPHDAVGEAYLRSMGFSEKICQLVGAHVSAKRYLTATDKTYYDGLSISSKLSLKAQGGPFTDEQVLEAQKDPFLENKLSVRRWDDRAKNPNIDEKPLEHFEDRITTLLTESRSHIKLHGREYRIPTGPNVAICVDGFDPEYLTQGIADGILPNLAKLQSNGFHVTAKSAMPSFTNPNNVSIITGVPVAIHGIQGNYVLDRETGKEEMIDDDSLLVGDTILELMSKCGVRVAAVTAKDKLRKILSHGLERAICFSAQKAASCSLEENGIEDVESWLGQKQPSQYSGDLSLFVLDAGIKLLEEDRADLFYLTLSDYIQHKYAPGEKESNEFLAALDQRIGRFLALGATVAVTGDHGMSSKTLPNGQPDVLYLEEVLSEKFGHNCARVICPIADPFVKNHGALGSFVRIYTLRARDVTLEMMEFCKTLPQVEDAMTSEEASEKYEMMFDREGDLVVVAKKHAVIGSRADEHDLSQLGEHKLRSHGGLSEQHIPLIMSRPATGLTASEIQSRQWRNFDIFDLLLNH